MKSLLRYLKDYKKESVLSPLFKLLEASFELLVPLVMASIIDVGIVQADKSYIIKMCLIMVALGLIGLACSITAQFYAAKAAIGFSTKLRHALFGHIQSLSFSKMDQVGTSTLITRMTSDINQVQSGVNMVLRLFMRSPFIVFGAMIMAFTIDIKAALVFVVTIPALSLIVFGIMLFSIPLYKKVQERLDGVLGITRENLTGARVIRAFNQEKKETEKFEERNNALLGMQTYVGRISALMNPLTYIVINLAIVVLLYVGALQVEGGILTQGQVVALVNYMSQILVELVKLANLIITVTKAVACGNRIEQVFLMKPGFDKTNQLAEQKESVKTAQKDDVVSFQHVSLRYYAGGEEALSDIDFSAKRGQTIGIIGGTGSGKSSLVNAIPRFYDIEKGNILVDGQDVRTYETNVLRNKIGMVMQKAVLFKGTIAQNLRWGKEQATDEELWEALRIAQAEDFVRDKEGGLEAVIEQEGRNLSGGQRQRLSIARALVRKPEILILDDSASALDFATDARLRSAIKEMAGETTVFIVSQRASSIQYADLILVLEDGNMAGMGTHEELLNSCEVYQEIYYSQFEKREVQS